MKNLGSRLVLALLLAATTEVASAQSFSISTTVTPLAGLESKYDFVLHYDQAGQNLQLTDNIWSWGFYLQVDSPPPTVVSAPTDWKWNFDSASGSVTCYTEGSSGWYNGDFGSNTLAPGGELAGFSFQGPYLPTVGVASALDVQFNYDQNSAELPGELANAVPEPGSIVIIGAGLLMAFRKRRPRAIPHDHQIDS
jgi:hypothetical protein